MLFTKTESPEKSTCSSAFSNSTDNRYRQFAWGLILLGCILQWFSPAHLSADAPFYLQPAVNGKDLIHPHHLFYAVFLRCCYLIGSSLGLENVPYLPMRSGMILFSSAGLIFTFAFLRQLKIRRLIAAFSTLLLAVSGLFWQFSTQMEAYIPAFSLLAAAAWVSLYAATLPYGKKMYLIIVGASFIIGITTTFHQAAALAAPSLGLMYYLSARAQRQINGNSRSSWLAILLVGLSGTMSLAMYVAGWLMASPGVSFIHWMTKYARWEGMPWGIPENLTLNGAKILFRSWGASWLNFTPIEFYDGVPRQYVGTVIVVAALFFICFMYLAWATWTKRERVGHIMWIAPWIIIVQLFVWWWTPFLKNFQAIAMLPQLTLLALSAESFSRQGIKSGRIALGMLAVTTVVTFGVNAKYMILPSLSDRLAPEGDLLLVRPSLQADDLFIAEWPATINMPALLGFNNTVSLMESKALERIPDWNKTAAHADRRVIVHRSSVGLSQVTLARSNSTFVERWNPILNQIEESAGGLEKLRASIHTDTEGLLTVTFGVSPELPLSGVDAYQRMAMGSVLVPNSSPDAFKYFMQRLPKDLRYQDLIARQEAAVQSGRTKDTWLVPFVDESNSALWFKGLDTSELQVTSESLAGKSAGLDPIIWTAFARPVDLSLYRYLNLEGNIKAPESQGETSVQIFFQFVDKPSIDEKLSIVLKWKTDGSHQAQTLDLSEYPFWGNMDRVIGFRIDPGDVPNSEFTVTRMAFNFQ